MAKKTPLYPWHVAHGAKMVEFGGYLMPVSYEGVLAEHHAVREACGLFDISHMGEIYLTGPEAQAFAQKLTSNDVNRLRDYEAQYSLLMNPEGFAIDDIIVYRLGSEEFMFCVNAANVDRDFEWIRSQQIPGVQVENRSEAMGMIALQGPKSIEVLQQLGIDLKAIPRFSAREVTVAGVPVLLSRTGYTGEEGCEFFFATEASLILWEALLEAGKNYGCVPIGLGARDTLRLEMGYVLYGHELNESINPYEAGLSWVIKMEGQEFIGQRALRNFREAGRSRKLVGVKMEEAGIPREGMCLKSQGREVGRVLSGTLSPTLKQGIATALVEKDLPQDDREIFIDIRGKMKKAKITKPPFIQRS